MFLLDTNTLIYYFKGQGQVATRLLATPPDRLAVSTVTLFEIETGLRKMPRAVARRRQLSEFIAAALVWELDLPAASAAAIIRADLERRGQAIGPLDNLIAGIAVARRATLVTHNIGEFSRVPRLTLTDWYG